MLRYLPSGSSLAVITTNRCNANCEHCISASAPERSETLTARQICDVVDQILVEEDLRQVTFTGGEPTLLKDDLLDAIAYVADKGISTRVVTNAKWAKNPVAAKSKIRALREAGLEEINISTDDYHLPDIPLERVKFAWEATKGEGFFSVALANPSGVGSRITPKFLEEYLGESIPCMYETDGTCRGLPDPLADGTIYFISNTTTNILGRGRDFVTVDQVVRRSPERFIGYCPIAHRNMALTPKGHLAACCGCEVEDNPVLDSGSVLEPDGFRKARHRADDNVLMVAIATLGPSYLKEFVESADPTVEFRNRYSNVCEICEEVTRRQDALAVLRSKVGDIAAAVLEVAPNGQADLRGFASLAARPNVDR